MKRANSSIARGYVELVQECFLKHLCMGTATMKEDIATEEEGEKGRKNMDRSGHEK